MRRGQEAQFGAQLRKIARPVQSIILAHTSAEGLIDNQAALDDAMRGYERAILPWARSVSGKMLERIDSGNKRAWGSLSKEVSRRLGQTVNNSRVGETIRALHTAQVGLITSIPRDAATRAQTLTRQAVVEGRRAAEVAAEIANTESVVLSRATLIARTEIAKTNSVITEARATSIGATHYFWRTMRDDAVRRVHRVLDGETIAWAHPPDIEGEGVHHPGQFPNCRCYPEPILGGKFF